MAPIRGRALSGNMRKLHVVRYSADLGGLVLAARRGAKTGSYVLALDDLLLEEIEAAQSEPGEDRVAGLAAPRSTIDSALTPREIQARLRAGRSVQEVASEAGVTVEWVERFAAPVLAEQASAAEKAGRAVLHTPRRGLSDRTLEASVLRNLALRGAQLTDDERRDGWSARQLVDSDWLIRFRFRNRGRAMTAEWLFNAADGVLTSRNRLGTELGFVEAGRRSAAGTAGAVGPARPTRKRRRATRRAAPRTRPAAKKATGRKAATKKAAAPRKVAARKVAAKKVPAKKVTARKGPAKKVTAKKGPAKKVTAKKVTAKKATVRKLTAKKVTAKRVKSVAVGTRAARSAPREQSTLAPIRVAAARIESPRRRATIPAPARKDAPPVGAHFARGRTGEGPARPVRADRPLRAARPGRSG